MSARQSLLSEVFLKIQFATQTAGRPHSAIVCCSWMLVLLAVAIAPVPAQTAHFAGVQTVLGSGYQIPYGLALDANGNLYMAEMMGNAVRQFQAVNGAVPVSPTVRTFASGFTTPTGVAVDASGNVYVTSESGAADLQKMAAVNGSLPASPVITTLPGFSAAPQSLAIDAAGNLFTTSSASSIYGTISNFLSESPLVNGNYLSPLTLDFISTTAIGGVTIDRSGSLVFADYGNKVVNEVLPVSGSYPASFSPLINYSAIGSPAGVAFDAAGNLYVGDAGTSAVRVYPHGLTPGTIFQSAGLVSQLGSGLSTPGGIAVDAAGDVYVSDSLNGRLIKLRPSPVPMGAVNLGSVSASIPLTFVFDTAGTLGSISVLTMGAANGDFRAASGSTCTAGASYSAGQSCILNVQFTPAAAGLRNGAAVLMNASGAAFATAYLYGTGSGPQVAFLPGSASAVGSGFLAPQSVAVDGAGNLFVADTGNGQVKQIAATSGRITASSAVTVLSSGATSPSALALDGAGNLYVADAASASIVRLAAAGGYTSRSTLGGGLSGAQGLAVDLAGNLYVADTGNNAVKFIPHGCTAAICVSTLGTGLSAPSAVAVDAAGNVYVADAGNQALKLIAAGSGATTTLVSGLAGLGGLALDSQGNLYATLEQAGQVVEWTAASGYQTNSTVASGLSLPMGLSLGANGNLYLANSGANQALLEDQADAPTLTFAATAVGSTSSDSPQTIALANIGNSPLSLSIPASGANPAISAGFTLGTAGSQACPQLTASSFAPATVAAGTSCTLAVSYSPASAIQNAGALTLTDNNRNAAGSIQSIELATTGGAVTPTLNWAAPAAIVYGTALSAAQLNATANVPGTFTYSPAAGQVPGTGTQSLAVTFTPTDAVDYTTATASVALVVIPATPQITWSTPASITFGTALSATQLNATANVAGSFTYSPAAGVSLTPAAQTLTTTFTPTDTVDYTTATASVTLTVLKYTPTITWPTPSSITFGTALSAMQLDATSNVPGTFSYSPAAATVLPAGTQTLTATFTPSLSNYINSVTSTVSLTVNKSTPSISWAAPAAITYGAALSATQLNATTSVAGTFSYSPAAGTVPSAGTQTLTATFTPTDTNNYATVTSTVILTVNKSTPTISWAAPAAITYGTALSATQLNAATSVAGTFSYTPAAGTVLSAGTQTLTATFTPTDTVDYTQATASVALTVKPAPAFTLSASPATLSLVPGASVTSTITIGAQNGFNSAVTLSASGLPSGVTAKFATNPATGSSVLTLTAAANAASGSSTVTVGGVSGSLTASAPIALAVQGFSCHVGYSIVNSWPGGFQAALTLNNTGSVAISNWTLTWTFANGQTVSSLWNGNASQSGSNVTVTSMSYNGAIAAGGSYTGMGFNGTWNSKTNTQPTSFSINGTVCQ